MQLQLFTDSLAHLHSLRLQLASGILANQTRIGYGYDLSLFRRWCEKMSRAPFPAAADTVLLFLTDQLGQGRKVSSARRRFHAIAHDHRAHGVELAGRIEALNLLRGAQRLRAEKPRRKRALTLDEIRAISAAVAGAAGAIAIRDRAILLVGFASALRSASLVALNIEDLEFTAQGAVLTVQREKQDQDAKGRYVGIPFGKRDVTCPVAALKAWLEVRGKEPGRLFLGRGRGGRLNVPLTAGHICTIVKRIACRAGLDARRYGSHSLRAGFITAAGEAGLSDLLIADHTGHRDLDVLRDYLRRTNVFRANACAALDL